MVLAIIFIHVDWAPDIVSDCALIRAYHQERHEPEIVRTVDDNAEAGFFDAESNFQ